MTIMTAWLQIPIPVDVPAVNSSPIAVRLRGNRVLVTGARRAGTDDGDAAGDAPVKASWTLLVLPCFDDETDLEAHFRDGVLTVSAPGPPRATSRPLENSAT